LTCILLKPPFSQLKKTFLQFGTSGLRFALFRITVMGISALSEGVEEIALFPNMDLKWGFFLGGRLREGF
jgi:hypothetical protein